MLDIVKITEIAKFDLDYHLLYYAPDLSSATETKIINRMQDWDDNDLDNDFSQLAPNVRNYGIRDDPENLRTAIRDYIIRWLGIDPALAGGGSIAYLERA